ncbi:hypothetical protein [Gorillibacterium timonense]|uniref:hypothetical protein n=1 Tax=Gorillibacterium timonense TaxID=1689269 RepID=UPI00071D2D54|nr:hypothetical protein [Gorillibacterium timonense]
MIRKVNQMPNMPAPYKMRDWREVSIQYDRLVFDFEAQGNFFPLIWWDRSRRNVNRDTFGLPSYLGASGGTESHEAINTVAAVLGATLAGVDKFNQNGHNWVEMLEGYFTVENGERLFLNRTFLKAGSTFWYELYPHILIYGLAACYPEATGLQAIMRETSTKWRMACESLAAGSGVPDFNHLAYDFTLGHAVDNERWKEPDAAAGMAWIQYMAYTRWGDDRSLVAARSCLEFLKRFEGNSFYEVLLPFGAYIAARMNAELGDMHDVSKLVNDVFEGDSACRPGWGVIAENWGGYDCHGLCGSLTDWGQRWDAGPPEEGWAASDPIRSGYAFAANTFALAAPLVPLVRYDSRFAADIGKWMLNAANAARLFYPRALPAEQQSCAFYRPDPDDVIAYEGLRKWWDEQSPYATGDAIRYSWGSIDIGLYGSSHVGIFGGIIEQTEVEGILRLDCLRTDFFHQPAYPTYLYFNPYGEDRTVAANLPHPGMRCYDAVTHRLLPIREGQLLIPAHGAVLTVVLPEDGEITDRDGKRYCNGIIIDYAIDNGGTSC